MSDPVPRAQDVVRPGWWSATAAGDLLRAIAGPTGSLLVRSGSRERRIGAGEVDEVVVWRAADGVRRHRLLGHDGRVVAVLQEDRWSTPGGRLAPLLASVGWPVRSAGADEVERPDEPERLVGGLRRGPAGAVAPVLLVLAAVVGLGASVSGEDAVEAARVSAVVAACCGAVGTLAAGTWWLSAVVRVPRRPSTAVRPEVGARRRWRSGAGCGTVDGRIVLWDGWGRHRTLPGRGRGTPAGLRAGADAVVLVDAHGDPCLRLPAAAWGDPGTVAPRVVEATGLPLLDGEAPAGGEEVVDPPSPSRVLPAAAAALTALALLPALVSGLWIGGTWSPTPWAWVPAATALATVLAAVAGGVGLDRWRRRGTARPRVRVGPQVLVWAPTVTAVVLAASPITYVAALPAEVLGWWLALLTVASLGCAALAVSATAGAHLVPGLAVSVLPVLLATANRETLSDRGLLAVVVLSGGSAVVIAAGTAGAVRGRRGR